MVKFILKNSQTLMNFEKIPFVSQFVSKFFVLDIESYEAIKDQYVADSIIKNLRYGDVTGKDTRKGRLADIDIRILTLLKDHDIVHDVGCSTGITSLDLYQRCKDSGVNVKITLSDKFLFFYIKKSIFRFIYDREKNIRQITLWRVLFDPNVHPCFFFTKYFFKLIKLFFAPQNIFVFDKVVKMVVPKASELQSLGELEILEYDIFRKPFRQFNFVRCMNVLNRSYFDDRMIVVGLNNLVQSLMNGGVLLIGRTDTNGVNRATAYEKVGTRIKVLFNLNGGSEIHNLFAVNFDTYD